MLLRSHKSFLRFKRNLYVNLIVFIGMLYMPAMTGCESISSQNDSQGINDSIKNAKHKQDSITFAKRRKARADSIAKAKADSADKAYQILHPPMKYGIRPTDFKPQEQPVKYGVPSNLRDN